MIRRILSCGITSYEPGAKSARIFSSEGVCAICAIGGAPAAAAGAGAAAAAGAFRPLPSFAAATSRAMTRPCGPEPAMRPMSTPASFASRRASGEEKTRLAPWPSGRAPSPPPSPRWGDGARAAGGGGEDFSSGGRACATIDGGAACGATSAPFGGGRGSFAARRCHRGSAPPSWCSAAAAAAAFGSSPSCAITAMS